MSYRFSNYKGFTLIEAVVAIGIFAIVSVGVYSAYSNVLDITIASQLNATALTVMANELEVTRNLKFHDIGVQGGSPSGIISPEKNINFSGFNFIIKTTVRNIDDPFDGVLGGVPNDMAPADYKLVELELVCSNCSRFIPIKTTTIVAPANLENSSINGNLFINAIDASGQPITQASVAVINNSISPAIVINDVTNNNGQLQLVDIATSSLGYQITVIKSGYSTERTYKPGDPSNPNPLKPHATVAKQQVTKISFAIDKASIVNLKTTDQMCKGVPTVGYSLVGSKLIGTDPNVIKNSLSGATGSDGNKLINNLEWDTYNLTSNDLNYDIGGTNSSSNISLNPDEQKYITWVVEPKNPNAILVNIQDQGGQAINDATVQLSKSGFDQIKSSGHRDATHTNWANSLNTTSKTPNLETDNPGGQITVKFADGKYATSSEELVSSTIDFGTPNINLYFLKINTETGGTSPLIGPINVIWNNVVGVTASNNNITKNVGAGWGNAGASSVQSFSSGGDGYTEFSTNENNTYKMIGLSNSDTSQHYNTIDFAIHLDGGGYVFVYENGSRIAGPGVGDEFGTYMAGDVFRVAVESGTVKYYKNGSLFYTSTVAPTYPLLVDTSLYSLGATITNVKTYSDFTPKLKIATNNDSSTWNFIGSDGTANTYYEGNITTLHSSHSGNRYLRYKVFMQTPNDSYTPKIDDLVLEFNSACGLDGQAYFSGLTSGNYTLSVQKNGYQNFNTQVTIGSSWQEYRATLIP